MTRHDSSRSYWLEGFDAHRAGVPLIRNPHRPHTTPAYHWDDGWNESKRQSDADAEVVEEARRVNR